jgi:hypothetical protein
MTFAHRGFGGIGDLTAGNIINPPTRSARALKLKGSVMASSDKTLRLSWIFWVDNP